MFLIQLLLPTGHDAAPDREFAQTRAELVERFGGVTAYVRSPARGAWTSPEGHVEQDDVVMVEVLADDFDRAWWREFARRLEVRFEQQEILVRATEVLTLD